MLSTQMSKGVDSWAICWYWNVFKNNGYVLYPPTSHVDNIGLDGSGTHGSFTGKSFQIRKDANFKIAPEKLPKLIQVELDNYTIVVNHIKKNNYNWQSVLKKFVSLFKTQ